MKALAILAVLALAVGGQIGCVTSSTVTDGDRQVVDQGNKAIEHAYGLIAEAREGVKEDSPQWTMLGVALEAIVDAQRGAAHLQEVHGPPKEPKPYSKENMTAAIAQSKEEHAGTPWGSIALGVGSAAAGIVGTMLGMPWLSSIFPALSGKWKAAADTGVQIVTALRREAEAPGGLSAKELLKIANEYVVSAPKGVDAYMTAAATAYEEKLGFSPTVKLNPTPPPAPPAVSPALAP